LRGPSRGANRPLSRTDGDGERLGEEGQTGDQRAVAEDLLEVEGEEEPHGEHADAEAEHDQVGADDRADAEQPERHQGVGRHLGFDDHEGDQQRGRSGQDDQSHWWCTGLATGRCPCTCSCIPRHGSSIHTV
jgi:hypothetical protein